MDFQHLVNITEIYRRESKPTCCNMRLFWAYFCLYVENRRTLNSIPDCVPFLTRMNCVFLDHNG